LKHILITGKGSYVGTNVEKYLSQFPDQYYIETLDMLDPNWRVFDFSKFDVIFHVAGIAHMKEKRKNKEVYFKVNRDLAIEVAKKSKDSGVKQFIFMSSMSVYGMLTGVITRDTLPKPNTYYGKSKYEAEVSINKLNDDEFKVAILRPPMIYGVGSPGNFKRLKKLALMTPIFPKIDNIRSMIYIDNLSEFIKQIIDNNSEGFFFPQNSNYVTTCNMVHLIAKIHGRKILLTKVFNPILRLLKSSAVNKLFGDLVYDMSMSEYISDYRIYKFDETIIKTEER